MSIPEKIALSVLFVIGFLNIVDMSSNITAVMGLIILAMVSIIVMEGTTKGR